jgi:hypothetical protein
MKQPSALIRRWMRNWYWNLRTMPIWDRLWQFYESRFRKEQSYAVDGNLYNFLFLSPPPSLDIFADSRVWNRATEGLPKGYTIPDRASLDVLLPMTGDYYGALFSNPLPMRGVYVEGSVWKRILAAKHEQYAIPDPASIQVLKPMTADYYNHLFTTSVSSPGIVVDGKKWGQIAAALPQGFRLPDSITVDALNKNKRGMRV